MFKVDVITPVYNNQHFIRKCVESAHCEEEVNRIIVVNDGSTDGTLSTLRQMETEFPKLLVVMHPGGINRGIACSRNLGIRNAVADWIAFLDSDDYYLPGRFKFTRDTVARFADADGVFEPVVNKILSSDGARRFEKSSELDGKVIAIKADVVPDQVFNAMYFGKGGVVHLDGLTVRRQLALNIGLFDENLHIVDDSVFRLKAAFRGRLFSGSREPVAVRTIHDTNNEPNIKPFDQYKKYEVLFRYLVSWKASVVLKRTVIRRTLSHYLSYRQAANQFKRVFISTRYLISRPGFIIHYFF